MPTYFCPNCWNEITADGRPPACELYQFPHTSHSVFPLHLSQATLHAASRERDLMPGATSWNLDF